MSRLDPIGVHARHHNRPAGLLAATLALALAGSSPGERARFDSTPILTSSGIIGPDGRPVGVIGGRERFQLVAPPGKVFCEVDWEISGAIAHQEVSIERGFVNTPLPCPLVIRPTEGATEVIVEFFWNGESGFHSTEVTAYYTDGTSGKPDGFSPKPRE